MAHKKKQANFYDELILRSQLQNFMYQHEQPASYENAIQRAEADELSYEQKHLMQSGSDMVRLALELRKSQEELRKAKKSMNEMAAHIRTVNKNCCKMEKEVRELSGKVDSLCKKREQQKKKLKKYSLQMHQQKKILRFMGAYMGVNNPTDDLKKILRKYSQKLDTGFIRNAPQIIDAQYREVDR